MFIQYFENEKTVIEFIETTLQEKFPTTPSTTLQEKLKSGVILCKLVNAIEPGTIPRISIRPLPFLQMENISNFLQASQKLGIPSSDLFQTVDLFEGKDMNQVMICVLSLARVVNGKPFTANFKRRNSPKEGIDFITSTSFHSNNTHNHANAITHKGTRRATTSARVVRSQEPPEIKTVLNYTIGNCIGRGQFGSVYKCLHSENGQVVAIKRILLDDVKLADIDELMQEVELLKSLSHPNIVKYEGFYKDTSALNIILEYVENGSLANLLKTFGNLQEKLIANYVGQILEGLDYLHINGVIHRDLKAANILTTKEGQVKLTDFGVAQRISRKVSPHSHNIANDLIAGTPNWMAPEIIELLGASTKSDIWSLGCTIIELFTGKPPYSDLNPMTTLFRIVEDDFVPLPDGLSRDLTDFLEKCLQKQAEKRASARDLSSHPFLNQQSQQPQVQLPQQQSTSQPHLHFLDNEPNPPHTGFSLFSAGTTATNNGTISIRPRASSAASATFRNQSIALRSKSQSQQLTQPTATPPSSAPSSHPSSATKDRPKKISKRASQTGLPPATSQKEDSCIIS